MIYVAIVFCSRYSVGTLEGTFAAKANARVSFFSVSLALMLANDAISVIRSRDQSLKFEGLGGFTAIMIAVQDGTMRNSLMLSLRNNPGSAAILLPESLGIMPGVDLNQVLSGIEDIKAGAASLEAKVGQIQAAQVAQGQLIQALSTEIDDVRDDARVSRQDIYSRLNEGVSALREVTGGNLGPTSAMPPVLLPPPEPDRPLWYRALKNTSNTVIGIVTLFGGVIVWFSTVILPEIASDVLHRLAPHDDDPGLVNKPNSTVD